MDDDAIIRLIRTSPEEGLSCFVQTYGRSVKGYLNKQFAGTLSPQEIEDIFCDAIRRLWQYAKSFDSNVGSLKSWFMCVVQRQVLDHLKARRRKGTVSLDLDEHDHSAATGCDEPSESMSQLLSDLEY